MFKIGTFYKCFEFPKYQELEDGLRNHCIKILDRIEEIDQNWIIIGGRTGSGKTKLIKKISNSIDLENIANHKGSAFGSNTTLELNVLVFNGWSLNHFGILFLAGTIESYCVWCSLETVNINLSDFEDDMSFLRVLGKGSKTRLVPLGRFAINAIKNWLDERKKIATSNDFNSHTGEIKTKDVALLSENEANQLCKELTSESWSIIDTNEKPRTSNPKPPFTTSTLQQEAARKLRSSARQTISTAQRLY